MVISLRLLTLSRGYATRRTPSRLNGTMDLDQFILRARVLSLYRTILRGTKGMPDLAARKESRKFARDEIERNRQEKDKPRIRYLLSTGKKEWEGMEKLVIRSAS